MVRARAAEIRGGRSGRRGGAVVVPCRRRCDHPLRPPAAHTPRPSHVHVQRWLTDDDIDDVLAQYDTNRDGVIRCGVGAAAGAGVPVEAPAGTLAWLPWLAAWRAPLACLAPPGGLQSAPAAQACSAAAAAAGLPLKRSRSLARRSLARRRSFEEFGRMSQDNIFLTGKLQEYQLAFRWGSAFVFPAHVSCAWGGGPASSHGLERLQASGAACAGACSQSAHTRPHAPPAAQPAAAAVECSPFFPHPVPRRAVDTGGNGKISATELFKLFERLEQPIRHVVCVALSEACVRGCTREPAAAPLCHGLCVLQPSSLCVRWLSHLSFSPLPLQLRQACAHLRALRRGRQR